MSNKFDLALDFKSYERFVDDKFNAFPPFKKEPDWFKKLKSNGWKRLHWGQRKLLMSELDFISMLPEPRGGLLVYAGSADGRHIGLLADLYPEFEFHLWDPRPFYPTLKNHKNIKLFNHKFTDLVAERYRDQKPYFISDIRTVPISEASIMDNQSMQWSWVKLMQPRMACLKFKMPYPTDNPKSKKYIYLDGEIRKQIWAPITSAETRLIVRDPNSKRTWDTSAYEGALAYFNIHQRQFDNWDFDAEAALLERIGLKKEIVDAELVSPGSSWSSYLKL